MAFSLSEIKRQLPFLEKISPNEWMEKLDQLNTRERNLVLGAIFGVLALVLYLSVSAGLKKLDILDKQLKSNRTALAQVEKLSAELKLKEEEGQKLQTRIVSGSSGFILASHMEKEAQRYRVTLAKTLNETRTDIGDNLEEVSTDVRIDTISFMKLLNMLTDLENNPTSLIRIKRLRIKNLPDPLSVETNFKITTYLRKS